MKKISLIAVLFLFSSFAFAQDSANPAENADKVQALSFGGGFSHGGGLLGLEYERMMFDQFALTIGGGLIGYNGGFNYHMAKTVDSSFIHVGVSHLIPGDNQLMLAEVSFNARFFGFLEASVGYGHILLVGDKYEEEYEEEYDQSVPSGTITLALAVYSAF